MMFNLYTTVVKEIGTVISENEYRVALPEAQRKLEHINNLNGTNHGEAYLAVLIAETIKMHRLTRYFDAINNRREVIC